MSTRGIVSSLLALAAIAAASRSAVAETRYRLHARDGELLFDVLYPEERARAHVGQPPICESIDVDLRSRVWHALYRSPIVTILDDGSMSIHGSVDGPGRLADETHVRPDGTVAGRWETPTPDVFLSVVVRTGSVSGVKRPPLIEVAVTRRLLGGERCSETWLGVATEAL